MAQGRDDYAQLEEGRSKLLLSPVPQGLSAATEVLKLLTLWEEQRFETLLQRAQEQLLFKRRSGKRHKIGGPPDPSARGDRARRRPLAPTGRLPLGSFPPCSPSTSKRTCAGLRSFFGPSAHSDPNLAPPPALPEST